MPTLAQIESALRLWLRKPPGRLGLSANSPGLRYVVNPGGFVNANFTVTDGVTSLHVKVATEDGAQTGLRRWSAHGDHLHEHHRAPSIIGLFPVGPEVGPALVLRHVEGRKPAPASGRRLDAVLAWLPTLHADARLARGLRPESCPRSCFDDALGNHFERFSEDLRFVRQSPPPFVTSEVLDDLQDKAELLERRAAASSAFAEPASAPIHGDLWCSNLLVDPGRRLWVLDWDELRLGDPALDLATLVAPAPRAWDPAAWRRAGPVIGQDRALRERTELLFEAVLLDWAIDPLADWVACPSLPDARSIRASKQRDHETAVEAYRRHYA